MSDPSIMKVNSLHCRLNSKLIVFLTVPDKIINPTVKEIDDNIHISWQKPVSRSQCIQRFSVENGVEENYVEEDGYKFKAESCTTYNITITSIGKIGNQSYPIDFTTESVGNIPYTCSLIHDSFTLIFHSIGWPEIEIVSSEEVESCWRLEWKFKFNYFKDWQCLKPLELFYKLSTVSHKEDGRVGQTN